MSEEQIPVDGTITNSEDDYDPQKMLQKTGKLQGRIIDAIGKMELDDIVHKPSSLESISSFLNGVNNTAVQTIRNGIVQTQTDVGAIADAVYDRMVKDKKSNIKRAEANAPVREIDTTIPDDVDLGFEDAMLERGITNKTFDDFAEEQGMVKKTNDENE